tara:strand:- start:4738 stop:5031 length:294 start_codon:yes stop_codon:yes gene_type:complete
MATYTIVMDVQSGGEFQELTGTLTGEIEADSKEDAEKKAYASWDEICREVEEVERADGEEEDERKCADCGQTADVETGFIFKDELYCFECCPDGYGE